METSEDTLSMSRTPDLDAPFRNRKSQKHVPESQKLPPSWDMKETRARTRFKAELEQMRLSQVASLQTDFQPTQLIQPALGALRPTNDNQSSLLLSLKVRPFKLAQLLQRLQAKRPTDKHRVAKPTTKVRATPRSKPAANTPRSTLRKPKVERRDTADSSQTKLKSRPHGI